MSTNATESRQPVRPILAVGAPLIVLLMGLYQFAYAVNHPEHVQLTSIMGWSCIAAAVALAVVVSIANIRWARLRRREATGAEAHLEP